MFLARTGEIPDVFPDMSVPDNWFNEMQLSKKKLNRIYLSDILSCGEEFNTKDLIPTFQQALEKYDSFASAEIKETKPKQKISHQAKTLIKQLFGR